MTTTAATMIGGGALRTVISYMVHPYRPRPSLKHWRQFLAFSMWITPGNVANYFNDRLDAFVVGAVNSAFTPCCSITRQ